MSVVYELPARAGFYVLKGFYAQFWVVDKADIVCYSEAERKEEAKKRLENVVDEADIVTYSVTSP